MPLEKLSTKIPSSIVQFHKMHIDELKKYLDPNVYVTGLSKLSSYLSVQDTYKMIFEHLSLDNILWLS
jgi:hypothetical protein